MLPMCLGVEAVIAKSYARIHKENLFNYGILPLIFEDPADYEKLQMLVIASVSPECDMQTAMQLAKAFPVVFFDLTNRIPRLTGLGHIPGKRPPSGGSQASEH